MRHILVVDDDLHTRLAIGIWLKQCGFRVAITDGGESGLAENMPQRALPLRARRRTFRERESKYGLNCQGEAMRRSLLSSPCGGGGNYRRLPSNRKTRQPIIIATDERLD